MAIFFCPSMIGFYNEQTHRTRKVRAVDPMWVRPMKDVQVSDESVLHPLIEVIDPTWQRPTISVKDDGGKDIEVLDDEALPSTCEILDPEWSPPIITIAVPDMDAIPDMIEVENPACTIPADAIEISDDLHREMIEAESNGKMIVAGSDGMPEAVDPPPPTEAQMWVTVRTMRDALLEAFAWRYERHARETRLNLATTDSLVALDTYAQALAEITNQTDPANIIWPVID